MKFYRYSKKHLASRNNNGFALIATILLMVLLAIITVGTLSLSVVTLRSSSQNSAQAQAQANARMALMIAIGELQKEMGPDMRISAKAGILDNTPTTDVIDGVANPHYLGVWDSWNTWLTDRKGSLSIQDTYKPGRDPSLFRRWLVSHPDSANYQMAITNSSTAEKVVLCGPGSAGPDNSNHVIASRIPIKNGSIATGSYAWWVSDESMKARIDLSRRTNTSSMAGGSLTNAEVVSSHTGRMGIETMDSMDNFNTSDLALSKMITTRQAGLSASKSYERFHDITAYNTGLLTDVRFGGLKADINLALESDTIPAEMTNTTLYGNVPFEAPIRPMYGTAASIVPQNRNLGPVSWRQVREYYRLYREGFTDVTKRRPIEWTNGSPSTKRFLVGKFDLFDWDTMGYTRQPVMLRQTWVLATSTLSDPRITSTGGLDYYIIAIPVMTLWNPYNVALQMDSKELSYLGSLVAAFPLRMKIYKGGVEVADAPFPDARTTTWAPFRPQYYPTGPSPNSDLTARQLGFRMVMTENTVSHPPIVFKPGEVRVFSTNTEILHLQSGHGRMNERMFYADPGYNLIQNTTPSINRGLKYRVFSHPTQPGPLEVGLYVRATTNAAAGDSDTTAYVFRSALKSGVTWAFQGGYQNDDGDTIVETGQIVNMPFIDSKWSTFLGGQSFWDMSWLNPISIDWIANSELPSAWVVGQDAPSRARWPSPGSPPLPIGLISIVAKSPQRLEYAINNQFGADYRNRTWLHSPPTRFSNFLMNPGDLNRADSAYQVHFRPVNGDNEISEFLEAEGRNGFYGGGYGRSRGQTHVTALSVATAPVVNLAAFAGVRMDRSRTQNTIPVNRDGGVLPRDSYHTRPKYTTHTGCAFGPGIGNGYAHSMIAGTSIYTRNNFGPDTGFNNTNAAARRINLTDDYWDHLFLANEELWDSWYCSGITPVVAEGVVKKSKSDVASDFFSGEGESRGYISRLFQPYLNSKSTTEMAQLVETTTAASGQNGWDRVGGYMLNQGQFNVNSTSKDAWKALLMSLAERTLAVNDIENGTSSNPANSAQVTLSRFPLANSAESADSPDDDLAWRGTRQLTAEEVDKLAEEIVRQVKLRGPFLNMTDFINRRLSNDKFGVAGTLQAAIDWDEFNAEYSGDLAGDGASINKKFKTTDAMIKTLPATYPNPLAARGSRYAGIPGYVMQSDILQGIASSLTVRGDTFLIRAYGESYSSSGQVIARAWCEAVVQRMPDYIDPTDKSDKKIRVANQNAGTQLPLSPSNRIYGRKFQIVSFKWLNSNEV